MVIRGNLIGTDRSGTVALPDAAGIIIENAAGNMIGGSAPADLNLISGNNGMGIEVVRNTATSVSGNTIEGNYIGTDITGTIPLGNGGGNGIGLLIDDNTAGAAEVVNNNLISANGLAGIEITSGTGQAAPNQIVGNKIGTDLTGTTDLSPSGARLGNGIGVYIQGAVGNTISNNVISGNSVAGIEITGGSGLPAANQVVSNTIGTDVSGTKALGNGVGVYLNGSVGNTIGGNLISGNMTIGVEVFRTSSGSSNTIDGNVIGTDASGTVALSNGRASLNSNGFSTNGVGVLLADSVSGASDTVRNNLISGNGLAGIEITGSGPSSYNTNMVQGNTIGAGVPVSITIYTDAPMVPQVNGILIVGSFGNMIGGSMATRNVITDNLAGVQIIGVNENGSFSKKPSRQPGRDRCR